MWLSACAGFWPNDRLEILPNQASRKWIVYSLRSLTAGDSIRPLCLGATAGLYALFPVSTSWIVWGDGGRGFLAHLKRERSGDKIKRSCFRRRRRRRFAIFVGQ